MALAAPKLSQARVLVAATHYLTLICVAYLTSSNRTSPTMTVACAPGSPSGEATNSNGQNGHAQSHDYQGDESSKAKWAQPQAVDYTALSSQNYDQGWGCNARSYEWKDEYGDVGPKYPELELELFGDPSTRHERTGLDFSQ